MSEDKATEQKGDTMSVSPKEEGITRRALLKGAAAAGGALVLTGIIDRARQVFGQPPPYKVELPVVSKRAEKLPEIKQGMYGIWQKEIGFEQNGYTFAIENGEKAGLVVRNWQPLLRLNEHYGRLHGYKSFTVSFKDESELTPEIEAQMRKLPMAYKDDSEPDQILFYKLGERKPGDPPYGRYGFLPIFGEYRESYTDSLGNLHLRFHIALFNREKYEQEIANFDPREVLPRRITENILWTILTGAKTNQEYSQLVSEYLLGREPFPIIQAWDDEFSAPAVLHDEYLFRVKV